ncbi:hypothetical protein E1286_02690 [Nonomuraea terrae]|uniref:Uncharacterized protein n=1 Tax=Nonomuraea terrae TaxID=2530383 RepID=A0A4R4ZI01_9ACTN|nr:hypothetical protein E1286_02690 [Nonomuraea terrae]
MFTSFARREQRSTGGLYLRGLMLDRRRKFRGHWISRPCRSSRIAGIGLHRRDANCRMHPTGCFRRCSSRSELGKRVKIIPRMSRDQFPTAASGGSRRPIQGPESKRPAVEKAQVSAREAWSNRVPPAGFEPAAPASGERGLRLPHRGG